MSLKSLFRKKTIDQILHDQVSVQEHSFLKKDLRLVDLTAFGIAAIIGAGIFGTIGNASANGGPAISLLFIFTAIACAFSAMCYAEFASRIPISGSAYTYAYASFGELVAWIIGWDLLMEYAVGNIAVAISWSDYFVSFLSGFNIHVPPYLKTDYLTAYRGYTEALTQIQNGQMLTQLSQNLQNAYNAWTLAPEWNGIHLIANLPACAITIFITYLVYIGIRESKVASNLMVLLKLGVILAVIAVGAFYVNPQNWSPFAPNGVSGVLKGISAVFFAYIGFDAISTTAEECKNPQRDLPRAMFLSLIICTVLYVIICLILTGMTPYKDLAIGDPLAFVFSQHHLNWFSGIIALSAIVAMASVLLVFQVGQPRIWMSMSRDGLLPPKFASIHPKYKTPAFSTILTGFVVAIPSLFMNLTEVTDLTSIGTLFAFVLVCAGILFIDPESQNTGRFKVPYFNSKYIVPLLFILTCLLSYFFNKEGVISFLSIEGLKNNFPLFIFFIIFSICSFFCFRKNLSLIPVLGLLVNLYLMTELGVTNWTRFLVWLIIGLVIYFCYGRLNSRLQRDRSN